MIFLNRIITPDGTELVSTHRHDYQTYKDKNGFVYMVDGGNEYLRRTLNKGAPHKEASVTDESDFSEIREHFKWGSFGVDGKTPSVTALKDLTLDHIEAIQAYIKDQTSTRFEVYRKLMTKELEYRKSS